MLITYRCHNGHEFDGHWKAKNGHVCPKCGDTSNGKNIDADEDHTPDAPVRMQIPGVWKGLHPNTTLSSVISMPHN